MSSRSGRDPPFATGLGPNSRRVDMKPVREFFLTARWGGYKKGMRTVGVFFAILFSAMLVSAGEKTATETMQDPGCQSCMTLPYCQHGGAGNFQMMCNGFWVGLNCCNEPGVRFFCSGFCAVWSMGCSYFDEQTGTFVTHTVECCACNEFCMQ